MQEQQKARAIVEQMFANDAFSQWLGIQIEEVRPGYCRLGMQIRKEMLNGFQIAHGGISFSLADSALAFASNSRGKHALSIDTQINHLAPLREADRITAEATELYRTPRLGHYQVSVKKADGETVALFRGMVYIKKQDW